jgi:hypothetical protein
MEDKDIVRKLIVGSIRRLVRIFNQRLTGVLRRGIIAARTFVA